MIFARQRRAPLVYFEVRNSRSLCELLLFCRPRPFLIPCLNAIPIRLVNSRFSKRPLLINSTPKYSVYLKPFSTSKGGIILNYFFNSFINREKISLKETSIIWARINFFSEKQLTRKLDCRFF